MEFLKKTLFCDEDVMQTDDIITYGFFFRESLREHSNIVDSKRWEPTDIKNISEDKSLLLTSSTVAIEPPVKKTVLSSRRFHHKDMQPPPRMILEF